MTEHSARENILTKSSIQIASMLCLMIFLAGCATSAPPTSTAKDAALATAQLENCKTGETRQECDDSLMQKYQFYLGMLSAILMR